MPALSKVFESVIAHRLFNSLENYQSFFDMPGFTGRSEDVTHVRSSLMSAGNELHSFGQRAKALSFDNVRLNAAQDML